VVEKQRAELVRTLAQSRDVRVTIRCSPAPAVLVYDGGRLLVELDPRPRGCASSRARAVSEFSQLFTAKRWARA
jgi:hypothetical protein